MLNPNQTISLTLALILPHPDPGWHRTLILMLILTLTLILSMTLNICLIFLTSHLHSDTDHHSDPHSDSQPDLEHDPAICFELETDLHPYTYLILTFLLTLNLTSYSESYLDSYSRNNFVSKPYHVPEPDPNAILTLIFTFILHSELHLICQPN